MAYQENTSVANAAAVINNLVTFMAANGWTVERNDLVGSSRTATIRIPGVSDYVHLYNDGADIIKKRISVGYDSGAVPALQPNVSARECRTNLFAGAYPKTWMFANADGTAINLVVAIAASSGSYRHAVIGVLDKAGSFTGGTYVDGTYWPVDYPGAIITSFNSPLFAQHFTTYEGLCRVDIPDDGRSNYIPSLYTSAQLRAEYTTLLLALRDETDENSFSGRSVFHPIVLYVRRLVDYWSPLGVYKNIRSASLAKFQPEQEVTIGSDVWKVFPAVRKAVQNPSYSAGPEASGNSGFAIKKEV